MHTQHYQSIINCKEKRTLCSAEERKRKQDDDNVARQREDTLSSTSEASNAMQPRLRQSSRKYQIGLAGHDGQLAS